MRRLLISTLVLLTGLGTAVGQLSYLPHAFQQNDWFLEYGENTAQYINPASISENDQIEIAVGLFQTISGKAGQEFIAAVHPFDYNHSLGVTVWENGSRIDGSSNPYVENAYQLAYAYRMPWSFPNGLAHKLSVGVNYTLIQFDPFSVMGTHFGHGLDLGLSYNPWTTSNWGHFLFGVAAQNVLQPQVKMTDGGNYPIPMNLNTSMFWRLFNRRLELGATASYIDVMKNRGDEIATEVVPSARVTYFLSPLLGLKIKYNKLSYPIIGATVNVKRVNLFRYLQLDLDMSHDKLSREDQDRGFVWNVRAITRVGPTREERIGEARYRRLKIEPENAYREAMRLYLARKFLLAAYAFGKVITKYPSFHLVDQAAYYKGKSFENLRMHDAARKVYEQALRDYQESDQVPKYYFQMLNIDYKEGKFDEATRKYQIVANKYGQSDVKSDADYVMGQIHYVRKDYRGAIALLTPILPGNANYVYARYTLGMCYVQLKREKEAIAAFQDIIDTRASNVSEQEMKEIAAVKLGHLHFGAEPPQLLKAAEYYGSVPPSSQKFDEALLGLAWSFIKVQKFDLAKNYAQELIRKVSGSFLVPEAHLLLGYCQYFEKDYDDAIQSFDNAIQLAESKKITAADIDKQKEVNRESMNRFITVQQKALLLSNQLPTKRVLEKREDLRPQFDEVHNQIEDYLKFLRDVEQHERFANNRERIIRDAKFTKGTVLNIKNIRQDGGPSQQELEELELE